jgi:hypothetical protein
MFEKKFMGLQSGKNPNFKKIGTLHLGVLGQNDIWVQPPWQGTNNSIKGKVVASPKSRPW